MSYEITCPIRTQIEEFFAFELIDSDKSGFPIDVECAKTNLSRGDQATNCAFREAVSNWLIGQDVEIRAAAIRIEQDINRVNSSPDQELQLLDLVPGRRLRDRRERLNRYEISYLALSDCEL